MFRIVLIYIIGNKIKPIYYEGSISECIYVKANSYHHSLAEIWLKCPSADSFLFFVEFLLNKGFSPYGVATLDGRFIPIEKLIFDNEVLSRLGRSSIMVSGNICGEIVYVKGFDLRSFIERINPTKIYVEFRRRRICLDTGHPIDTSIFFDNYIRILKPMIIPKKIILSKKN